MGCNREETKERRLECRPKLNGEIKGACHPYPQINKKTAWTELIYCSQRANNTFVQLGSFEARCDSFLSTAGNQRRCLWRIHIGMNRLQQMMLLLRRTVLRNVKHAEEP